MDSVLLVEAVKVFHTKTHYYLIMSYETMQEKDSDKERYAR